jgi:hypothetical protein
MDATQIGSYHLADNPELYESQRDNNFEFIVTGIDNILRVGAEPGDTSPNIENASQTLRFSVVSSSVPMFSQEVLSIRRGNSIMKFAGAPTFSEGTLVVNDYIGADTKSALMAWQNLSYNVKTQMVGYMSDYKKNCWLIEYDPNFKIVRQWILYGCWITGISQPEFDAENGDKRQITATIAYDWAEMQMPDSED